MSTPAGSAGEVVSRLYEVGLPPEAWVDGVAHALNPVWSRGAGVMAWTFRASQGSPPQLQVEAVAVAGGGARRARSFHPLPARFAEALGPERSVRAYGAAAPIISGRAAYGEPMFERLAPDGIEDFLATATVGEGGRGLLLGAPALGPTRVSAREQRLGAILADHARTALRLRALVRAWRARGPRRSDGGDEGDDPGGPPRRGQEMMASELVDALRRGELALIARRRAGQGVSFLWAQTPGGAGRRSLSDRQRRVVAYLQRGWSGKQIALSLGTSQSTVSRDVDEVTWKLGLRSSADIARAFAALSAAARPASEAPRVAVAHRPGREVDLWALRLSADSGLLGLLTPAERAVVGASVDGASTREIASRRGVSQRTVANQLQRAYRKLRVQSRDEAAVLLHAGRARLHTRRRAS